MMALDGVRPAALSKSALSHFPLVNDPNAFKSLDGWLLDVICRSYAKRCDLVAELGTILPNIRRASLLSGDWYGSRLPNETVLPSEPPPYKFMNFEMP